MIFLKTFADWHCDTASAIFENKESLYDASGHINLKMLENYDSPIQTFAVWLKRIYYPEAYLKTVEIIDYFKNEVNINRDKIALITGFDDIIKNNGKICAFLSIEGCEALEGSLEKLYSLYSMGVRAATLTWNYKNCVATGVMESSLGGGLTDFGRQAVKAMERLGIVIDVSHLSDEGFYDVQRHTEKPFVATHSNCRSICSFPRNLTDDQLRIIGERDGIAGLKICGEDHICLGCDFDGIPVTPDGMENVTKIGGLLDIIEEEFGKETAEKIGKENFMRIIKELL